MNVKNVNRLKLNKEQVGRIPFHDAQVDKMVFDWSAGCCSLSLTVAIHPDEVAEVLRVVGVNKRQFTLQFQDILFVESSLFQGHQVCESIDDLSTEVDPVIEKHIAALNESLETYIPIRIVFTTGSRISLLCGSVWIEIREDSRSEHPSA